LVPAHGEKGVKIGEGFLFLQNVRLKTRLRSAVGGVGTNFRKVALGRKIEQPIFLFQFEMQSSRNGQVRERILKAKAGGGGFDCLQSK
jgi:hypothetical protein